MRRYIKRYLPLFFLCFGTAAAAQSLDQARKLYNDGNYAAAKPVFEKYIKISPKDPSYNHWYGVCLYETGEIEASAKYLEFASSKKIQESFRYLGQLYFRTYRFDESAEAYETYIDLLKKKKQDTESYEARLRLSTKAERMLENTEDVQIIDSVIVDKNHFLSAYKLTPESGTVQYFDDFFEGGNTPETSSIYINQRGDRIFYSMENNENGYDLFTMHKTLDGWVDEQILPENINTKGNERCPFMLTDGVTLYFASDKGESLGGYDLYITRFNKNTNTYLNPEQLGMPFNSIYNDYLMVIDEVKEIGWFATDRFQSENRVVIYTFIPNDAKTPVDSDDMAYKKSRALIASIEESWKQPDYTELQDKARAESVKEEQKREFTFTINNQIDYYLLSDFKDEGAKNLFVKAQQTKRELENLSEQLQTLREAYAKKNSEEKLRMTEQILEMEERQQTLTLAVKETETQARNQEIKHLNK